MRIPKLKKVPKTFVAMVWSFALFEKTHTQEEAKNFGFMSSALKENVS